MRSIGGAKGPREKKRDNQDQGLPSYWLLPPQSQARVGVVDKGAQKFWKLEEAQRPRKSNGMRFYVLEGR